MKKKLSIDVERLVNDCGGVNLVRLRTGIQRTAFYSMFRRGKMTTDQLALILDQFEIDVRNYVVEK